MRVASQIIFFAALLVTPAAVSEAATTMATVEGPPDFTTSSMTGRTVGTAAA